jgi:hypothetical protein
MVGLVTIPFSFVIGMAMFLKPAPEAKLDAEVSIKIDVWKPKESNAEDRTRLIELLVVHNPTQDTWRNVAMALNKQFYFSYHEPVPSGATVSIPLSFFVTKSGSVSFRPATQKVNMVTVFAQVPSGERAVFERTVDPDELGPAPANK